MNALVATGSLLLCVALVLVLASRAIGWGLKQGRTPAFCIALSTFWLLGVYALALVVARVVFHQDLTQAWHREFENSLAQTIGMYRELGLDKKEVEQAARLIRILFLQGAVGWIVVSTTGLSLVIFQLQRRLSSRLLGIGIPVPPYPRWRASENMIWFLIASLVGILLGSWDLPLAGWVGLNGLIITGSFYFFYGFAVVMFFVERRSAARIWRLVGLMLVLFFPSLLLIVTLIGVLDTWWDWRKLRATSLRND